MKNPVRVNNIILDRDRILWIQCNQDKKFTVTVRFTDGKDVVFEGQEAIDIWELFDEPS